jgi:uncharacterized protein (TIGR03435 family)
VPTSPLAQRIPWTRGVSRVWSVPRHVRSAPRIDSAHQLLAAGLFGNRSGLRDRLETLLYTRTFSPRPSAHGVVALGLLALATSLTPHWIAFAQQTRPEFEVASIKLNKSGNGPSQRDLKPGSMVYTNRSLMEYIYVAWDLAPYQVTHGTSVSLYDRDDIEARAASRVPEAQVRLMLRSLLQDRFKLTVHHETREVSAYVLTVAKGGPHFKASDTDGPLAGFVKEGSFNYRRTSMSYLAGSVLTNLPSLGRPVVDHTGLDGIYDLALKLYDPDPAKSDDLKGGLLQQLDNGLQASLKDLGLKLELQKTPIEYLVVEHAEQPDAN